MLDDGQVERSDSGGRDRRDRLRHSASKIPQPSTEVATCSDSSTFTTSTSSSSRFLFGTRRRHESVPARELRVVRLLVRLEYRRPAERLAAQRAPERPFAGVHSTVVLHVVPELERFAAELTLERPVAGVRGQVADQRGHVRERFAAKLA